MFKVGLGYDIHALVKGRPLILGGVKVDYDQGLSGDSDADVLIHAIIDAILGAAGEGDIGEFFGVGDSEATRSIEPPSFGGAMGGDGEERDDHQ